jgi:membrane protease YdiL (CAAX protease family)
LVASLVLGFFWALWHLPYMFSEGSALATRPLGLFFLNTIGLSILYTWIFNNTRGSVLLAILFHASGNTTAALLGMLSPAAADVRVYILMTLMHWVLAVVLLLTSPVFARAASRAGRAILEK